ncbi:uncharacterized protein YhaN [Cytobacillus eiseniae]|uniref:Uncharacterized protein YhaN n=1 Tax=Cytobacillus eiseniae TaxID=762947 RepID=A0ABS4RDT7_9BACI|nr:uncharacterized protein YhaN [Cytobacillus eiseniae]
MKITELHIYGYGKLTDLKIANLHEFQIIYGENEAGKSTIMSFIHSMLFGFPTKQQSELRYEPKEGAKYGGQLTAEFPAHGKVVIERVKGKAAGDVSVRFEDGRTGEDECLKDLLSHVDKTLFQSIFSFNIHGLQNIHQMKGDDLGRFLFSAGALGTDQLLQAENTLQKEMDLRFKPNGKKPRVNEKLRELKQLHQELKKVEQQNDHYWKLLKDKVHIEEEIKKVQGIQHDLYAEIARLEAWKQVQPIKAEERMIEKELESFSHIQFPVDGLARLERFEEMMKPLEGKRASLASRVNRLEEEIKNTAPNESILKKEHDIHVAAESLALIEKLRQEEEELKARLQLLLQKESVISEKLHLTFQEDEILSIDTSMFMKEKIAQLEEEYKRLKARKYDLDDRFNEDKQLLEEIEEKIQQVKRNCLPKEKRALLEEKVKRASQKIGIEQEMKQLDKRHTSLLRAQKKDKDKRARKKGQERIQFVLFCMLFLLLLGWGISVAEWMIVMIGAIGIAFSILLYFKKSTSANNDFFINEIEEVEERKKQLMQMMSEGDNYSRFEREIAIDNEYLQKWQQYKIFWEQRNEQYERTVLAFEAWEREMMEQEGKMVAMGAALSLPRDLALHYLADAFQLIEEQKQLYKEKKLVQQQHLEVCSRLDLLLNAIQMLGDDLLEAKGMNPQETVYLLKKGVKEETEKRIMISERREKLVELEEELKKLITEWEYYEKEQSILFQLAEAINAEHFREIGHLAGRKMECEDRLNQLKRQMKQSVFSEKEQETYLSLSNIDATLQEKKEQFTQLREKLPLLQQDLAQKKIQIESIEEGGLYADLLHKYKQMKAELNDEAKDWAKYAMAKEILERTIETFKNERMPKMLEKAEEFLSFLTDGSYSRIYSQKDSSGFLIRSKNEQLFEANELSQATREQVYISFRLALAETIYEKYSFPIIIDDSFVNFDYKRTEKVISLLKSLKNRQILLFTCHQHLLPSFKEEQILYVNHETTAAQMTGL